MNREVLNFLSLWNLIIETRRYVLPYRWEREENKQLGDLKMNKQYCMYLKPLPVQFVKLFLPSIQLSTTQILS